MSLQFNKFGKALLDLNQIEFCETLTGQPDLASESPDHVATVIGKETKCFNSSILLKFKLFLKQIDP